VCELAKPRLRTIYGARHYGRFVIEPIDHGYGRTFGDALRRALMTSVPGAAVTAIRIKGVSHEPSTIRGLREDVAGLVQNVKGVCLRSWNDRAVTLQLLRHGVGVVRAGDITTPDSVEIVDPAHYLCTIDEEDATLALELTVELNKGYSPADQRAPTTVGEIPVDATFTPVLRVDYSVEHWWVDETTDHHRLDIEIWTNGAIRAREALRHAIRVLVQYCQNIADFDQLIVAPSIPSILDQLFIPPAMDELPIDALRLRTRIHNALKRAEIVKIGELLGRDEHEWERIRHVGEQGAIEIRERLLAFAAQLGAGSRSR